MRGGGLVSEGRWVSQEAGRHHAVPGGPGARRRGGHHGEGPGGGEALLPGLPGGLHLGADRRTGGAGETLQVYIDIDISIYRDISIYLYM